MHFLLAACALSPSLLPQEPPNAGTVELARAVRALGNAEVVHFSGYVSERTNDEGQSGAVMVLHGGGDGAKKFSGAIELVHTKKDELCLISKSKLPEVILYDDGMRTLVRTTVEDEPTSTADIALDMTALLEPKRLADAIEKAGAKKHDDGPRFTCELPARLVKNGGGLASSFGPKVMRVDAEITLDEAGAVATMKLDVTRSDPFAGVTRRAIQGGGGGAISVGTSELSDDEVGATSVYEIHVEKDAPSARMQSALTAMREVARDAR
jgi:hypothetical protein